MQFLRLGGKSQYQKAAAHADPQRGGRDERWCPAQGLFFGQSKIPAYRMVLFVFRVGCPTSIKAILETPSQIFPEAHIAQTFVIFILRQVLLSCPGWTEDDFGLVDSETLKS